jgi:hypothetical protein
MSILVMGVSGVRMAEKKWFTLVPFHAAEGLTMKDAAKTGQERAHRQELVHRSWHWAPRR